MKFIVSGGTGFIGRQIVDLLRAHGHYVGIYTRNPGSAPRTDIATYMWDPLSGPPTDDSLNGMDAVLHLAGEPVAQRWNDASKERIRASRVEGTRHLVDVISRVRHKPKVLVSASAIGFYGDRGEEILTEEAGPGKTFLAGVCRAWEAEADRAAWAGVRVVKIRIGFVLGKGGGAMAQFGPLFKLGLGGRLGSGKQWMPWVHAQDVAKLFMFAAENEVSGVLNGVAPNAVRNSEFTKALGEAVHRPAIFPAPPFVLKLVAGDVAQQLLDSGRVVPAATERAGFKFDFPEIRPALADIV